MEITVVTLTDGRTEWKAFKVTEIYEAQRCVQDLVGKTICKQTLDPHGITENNSFLNLSTAKTVYANMHKRIRKDEVLIVNKFGGYCTHNPQQWKILKEERVKIEGRLEDLLL